jgi:CBS domain-containing protein
MTRASDIMTADVQTVHPDDEVSDVLTRLANADFDGFPVVDDERVVGVVTQGDLVDLFQPEDRTLWIPVGLPPFVTPVEYAVDVSWDDLDLGVDLARSAGESIRTVMTESVVTVEPDDDIDHVLGLVADAERDINRLPVVDDGRLVGIITREDVLRALRTERDT